MEWNDRLQKKTAYSIKRKKIFKLTELCAFTTTTITSTTTTFFVECVKQIAGKKERKKEKSTFYPLCRKSPHKNASQKIYLLMEIKELTPPPCNCFLFLFDPN